MAQMLWAQSSSEVMSTQIISGASQMGMVFSSGTDEVCDDSANSVEAANFSDQLRVVVEPSCFGSNMRSWSYPLSPGAKNIVMGLAVNKDNKILLTSKLIFPTDILYQNQAFVTCKVNGNWSNSNLKIDCPLPNQSPAVGSMNVQYNCPTINYNSGQAYTTIFSWCERTGTAPAGDDNVNTKIYCSTWPGYDPACQILNINSFAELQTRAQLNAASYYEFRGGDNMGNFSMKDIKFAPNRANFNLNLSGLTFNASVKDKNEIGFCRKMIAKFELNQTIPAGIRGYNGRWGTSAILNKDTLESACLYIEDHPSNLVYTGTADSYVCSNNSKLCGCPGVNSWGCSKVDPKIMDQQTFSNLITYNRNEAKYPSNAFSFNFYQQDAAGNLAPINTHETNADPLWVIRGKCLFVKPQFLGALGYCGSFKSPLMLFFDEKRPQFAGMSAFPLYNTGKNDRVAWPEAGSAGYFLALDKKGNKKITKSEQLFGANDKFSNGFVKLQTLDSNKDGVIDSKDAVYKNLVLWNDKNGDGKSDKGEVYSLKDMKVESLNLNYLTQGEKSIAKTDRASSKEFSSFVFKNANGEVKSGVVIDIWLAPFKDLTPSKGAKK